MTEKRRYIILTCIMAAVLFSLSVWSWVKGADDFSESERRVLQQFPEVSAETIFSGEFMTDFESYTLDQFPLRDSFRTIKSISELGIFGRMDNNDIYLADGHVSKLEYPFNPNMCDHAAGRFEYIYDSYLSDSDVNVYFSIIPDKNYFLAEQNGYLSLDYAEFIDYMRQQTDYMQYIDITGLLSIDDYYTTDTHWRQESITDVAQALTDGMGASAPQPEYTVNTLSNPFYGVYYGQSALPLSPDTIKYLTSDTLVNCIVTSYDTGAPIAKTVYDMAEANGKDPYEMFLCGSDSLVTLENPNAQTDRELVIFRDSFASSLVPLMAESYAKITLVDIRYIQSSLVGNFVEFSDQDVLFMYSTMMLNNSLGLR